MGGAAADREDEREADVLAEGLAGDKMGGGAAGAAEDREDEREAEDRVAVGRAVDQVANGRAVDREGDGVADGLAVEREAGDCVGCEL